MKIIKYFKNLGDKFYNNFTEFLKTGGGYFILAVALVAIAMAVISHYYLLGFNLMWFLFFELPLYIFCGWALWKALKIYKQTLSDQEKYEQERQSKNPT